MVSLGTSIGGFIPAIAAVNSWMAHRRATAMALVLAGGSIGGLMVPLMAWGMTAHGWRTALIGVGVTIMLAGPLIAWVMWRRPPDMRRPARAGAAGASAAAQYDFTPKQALGTRAFWAISGAHSLANLSVSVVQSQVVLHLEAVGLSITKASLVVPVMGATAFAAQIVGGLVGDRFDKRYPAVVFLLIHGVSVVVLAFTESFAVAMAFAVLWGIGFGGRTPVLHAMRGDFFGRRHYATIMSLSAVPMALGMTVAPLVAGRVFDIQGTYRWVFVGLAGTCVVAAWVVMYAKRPAPPRGAA
jgi:MFS family permease